MALRFRTARERMRLGSREGLEDAAKHLEGVSRDLTPIEEGDLARTGRHAIESDEHATVTYGGQGLADYAQRQHEELTWRHDPGKQAKYLEQPLGTEAKAMKALIAASLRRALR